MFTGWMPGDRVFVKGCVFGREGKLQATVRAYEPGDSRAVVELDEWPFLNDDGEPEFVDDNGDDVYTAPGDQPTAQDTNTFVVCTSQLIDTLIAALDRLDYVNAD